MFKHGLNVLKIQMVQDLFIRVNLKIKNMTYVKLKKELPAGSFNNLLENFYSPLAFLSRTGAASQDSYSAVKVNIRELSDKFELNLMAPGFAKEDFEIKLEKELLTIAVNSKKDEATEGVKYIRKEFRQDGFKRSFHVNENIDTEQISALYLNGILVVTLAKKAPVAPLVRAISIQ